MNTYLFSIQLAFMAFPILALLFTVPYTLFIYHKYGSISLLRTAIVYTFILYLLAIYLLVILPLPSMESVQQLTTPIVQLIPFQFIADFLKESGFLWNHIFTYPKAFLHPSFYNVLFNVIMFLPLGIYMRYYFRCKFKTTLKIAFLFSLFFELTQLTGLYGVYPRPYRLFDVDDLLINVFGAACGYWFTPIIAFFLPSRQVLDERSYEKGRTVSLVRRFFAFLMDWVILGSLYYFFPSIPIYGVLLIYFVLLPTLWKGQTVGKALVRIRVVREDSKDASWYHLLIRYFLLYGIILAGPTYVFQFISYCLIHHFYWLFFFIPSFVGCLFLYILFFFQAVFGKNGIFYEVISKTKHVSTISVPDQLIRQ